MEAEETAVPMVAVAAVAAALERGRWMLPEKPAIPLLWEGVVREVQSPLLAGMAATQFLMLLRLLAAVEVAMGVRITLSLAVLVVAALVIANPEAREQSGKGTLVDTVVR